MSILGLKRNLYNIYYDMLRSTQGSIGSLLIKRLYFLKGYMAFLYVPFELPNRLIIDLNSSHSGNNFTLQFDGSLYLLFFLFTRHN